MSSSMTVVKVEQGLLEGAQVVNGEGSYFAFKGVPYAKPPVADLRFKPPQPPEQWEDIRKALQHGPVCPQYNDKLQQIEEGSEDCLYLNVYTPNLEPNEPYPVMVWIHGGAFYTGSGNSDFYGPEFFMKENVVLVTVNYRLEVLGFLALDIEECPGNNGLKDQVAALRWIKRNIGAFGGDVNNVTGFGCSAGSASISYHLVSEMSKGLLDKAICQSGVCLNEWGYNLYAKQRAFQLGKILGNDTDDPVELFQFLKTVPVGKLVHIRLPPLGVKHEDLVDQIFFGPVIENGSLPGEHFITEPPYELVKKARVANIPTILGFTSSEGMEILQAQTDVTRFLYTIGSTVPRELRFKLTEDKLKEADNIIRKHFFGKEPITDLRQQEFCNLYSDLYFISGIRRWARYAASFNTSPIYLYKFVAETGRNIMRKRYGLEQVKGVCHADEITYLFHVSCLDLPLDDEARSIINQFVRLWTDFAKTGNPVESTDARWPPFKDGEENCCVIGRSLKLERFDRSSADLWDIIYDEMKIPNGQ